MKPHEAEVRRLVADWIRKADLDFDTVVRLIAEERFRDIVAFHAQQAVEKYLKALLTRRQVEFPKTHVIRALLVLVQPVEPALAQSLAGASWLSPFGAEIRYPGDQPETAPGDAERAHQLARKVRDKVRAALHVYLSAGSVDLPEGPTGPPG
jgi:HEPN domain-containing protein